jgi:hypothetical protein
MEERRLPIVDPAIAAPLSPDACLVTSKFFSREPW